MNVLSKIKVEVKACVLDGENISILSGCLLKVELRLEANSCPLATRESTLS